MASLGLPLNVDFRRVASHVSEADLAALAPQVAAHHAALERREGPAADWGGWLHRPSGYPPEEMARLEEVAAEVREKAEVYVSVGIGGSYLGGRAAVAFAATGDAPEVLFYGHHLSADALAGVERLVGERSLYVNMISRGGGTVEPGVAFRFFRRVLEARHGPEAKRRIIVTTVRGSPLWRIAGRSGYRAFEIPQDIGGRYSAFTPAALLPAAVAGVDIERLVAGGAAAEAATSAASPGENAAYRLAAVRRLLHGKGRVIEVMAAFDPALHYPGQWWRQLAGESEGKGGRGIFPACVDYTTDLHSMGQWMQQGARNVFETFLLLEAPDREAVVPEMDESDGFGYLAGKRVSEINRAAYRATAEAHLEGGVPNLAVSLPGRTPEALGAFFYFFMRVVAMTGMLFGVNPFDQPGVEAYKNIMYRLLGRPGA